MVQVLQQLYRFDERIREVRWSSCFSGNLEKDPLILLSQAALQEWGGTRLQWWMSLSLCCKQTGMQEKPNGTQWYEYGSKWMTLNHQNMKNMTNCVVPSAPPTSANSYEYTGRGSVSFAGASQGRVGWTLWALRTRTHRASCETWHPNGSAWMFGRFINRMRLLG